MRDVTLDKTTDNTSVKDVQLKEDQGTAGKEEKYGTTKSLMAGWLRRHMCTHRDQVVVRKLFKTRCLQRACDADFD